MTLLVISPDYASHALPLITLASAWQRRGARVVFASGPAVAPLVRAAGMDHVTLIMSRGSNAGVLDSSSAVSDEKGSLEGFFAATHRGMVDTLRYQAIQRATDLLWQPRSVARRTMDIVESIRPDDIVIDHLAFAASIGLRALGVRYADAVLGHPTALPVGNEVYGTPRRWPPAILADAVEVASLRATAIGVSEAFTHVYNQTLRMITSEARPVPDAFGAHGHVVLYNYPERLHDADRRPMPRRHAFLGSLAREEHLDDETADWARRDPDASLIYVSFGTFLSARSDVLARVAASLRRIDGRVAMATGSTPIDALGPLPEHWHVRPTLPQVGLLRHASLAISHAGNNTVTEALTHGVPILAMPFSTDQFDGAAAVERSLAGLVVDPNGASRPLIAGTAKGLLSSTLPTPALVAADVQARPGPEVAYASLHGVGPSRATQPHPRDRAAIQARI